MSRNRRPAAMVQVLGRPRTIRSRISAFGFRGFGFLARASRAFWPLMLLVALGGALLSASAQTTAFSYDPPGNLVLAAAASPASPVITAQPLSPVLSQTGSVYLTVAAAGPGPLGYQWLSNGVPIAGATGDTLILSGQVLPTNLVSNGSFESPPVVLAPSQSFSAGTNVAGWVVESSAVNLIRSTVQPFDGGQCLDLNYGAPGIIYQDLATTPGQQYYLHFASAGNLVGAPAIKTNQVWWNGALLDTVIFNTAGHTTTAMGWTNRDYLVTATNTTTRLRFVSLTAGGFGPVLDGVSVTAVPSAPVAYTVVITNASGSVTSTVASVQIDTDGNGLPDAWELAFFGSIGQDPNGDPDGDGVSNLNEYLEGTNPTNAASFRPRLYFFTSTGGTVAASPVQPSYGLGDNVLLTATPNPGWLFLKWYGSVTNTNATFNLVMDGTKSVTGLFGQSLTNGALTSGALISGATNVYGFPGNTGDSILLRMGTTTFNPRVSLYSLAGTLLGSAVNGDTGGRETELSFRLTNSGLFMVVLDSYSANGNGPYSLTLAQSPGAFVVSPGDEGGPLTNGWRHTGNITVGDLDLWSFSGAAGED